MQGEDDKNHYQVDKVLNDILPSLLAQWKKANAKFERPVIIHVETIKIRLKKVWDQALKVAKGRVSLAEKQRFTSKLDKLFEILTCKCQPICVLRLAV